MWILGLKWLTERPMSEGGYNWNRISTITVLIKIRFDFTGI